MLIPKASHLVERVAERLLRSGALDDSAAQLLRQPGSDSAEPPAPEAPTNEAALNGAPLNGAPMHGAHVNGSANDIGVARAEVARRSSLFAPPPNLAVQGGHMMASPQLAPALGNTPDDEEEQPESSANRDSAELTDAARISPPPIMGPVLPNPAMLGQARPLGGIGAPTALLDRAPDFATTDPTLAARGLAVDPASGLLQGPLSVDAVSLERAGMVDWSRTRTRISEEFRLVQRQIIRSAFGPGAEPGFSNLLLVTSARPGEGKSFMSTNLSGSIARQGDHHVLLVDADSKRDSICYSLGLAQARGLLDLAANPKLDPSPLIVKTPIERLSILPVGRERERSAELFSTKEMTRLIQSLGRRYADRLLILDAPPCLSTSDPAVLAQVVGQILFVVEADRTQRDEIEASLDLIQACPTITMVLNKQQISSRYTFGAYSSYYSS
jgi:protein-tyrosine kinase